MAIVVGKVDGYITAPLPFGDNWALSEKLYAASRVNTVDKSISI